MSGYSIRVDFLAMGTTYQSGPMSNVCQFEVLRKHLERVYQCTFILVGLFVRSLLKRVGKGSGGGSSKQGGEHKEFHDCCLRFEIWQQGSGLGKGVFVSS